MSWTPAVVANNVHGLSTWDSTASRAASYSGTATWPLSCVAINTAGMVALHGSGLRPTNVQSACNASSFVSAGFPTFSTSFLASVTSGNAILVDVVYNCSTRFGVTTTVTDSQGNTYTPINGNVVIGSAVFMQQFLALNVTGGSVTITITQTGAFNFQAISMAIQEYVGVSSFDAGDFQGGASANSLTCTLTTTGSNDLLHIAAGSYTLCPGVQISGGGDGQCPVAWLSINEPGSLSPAVANQWVDQSSRLSMAEAISFSWIVKQRGSAKIPLYIAAGDSYMPTIGSQVCLWDLTDAGDFEVFSGTIDTWDVKWLGLDGDRIVTLACVSLEQCFDTIRLPSLLFTNTTCGAIFTALLAYASGAPVGIGPIDAGADVANFLIADYPSIADVFDRLATLSEYVWGVDPGNGNIYFTPPSLIASPFIVDSEDVLWEQMTLKEERHDYRNRQILKPNANAAVLSSEYFVGIGQLNFTLLRPVDQVTNAWITQNIQNSATGTFSAQPNPSDTVTIGFGPNQVWQANFAYSVGTQILDPNGYVQKVTATTGNSGATQPSWVEIYGETTTDHDIIWTNQGPLGFGGNVAIYTFVTALDNTQFGQVLIGVNVAATAQNLADAINGLVANAGITFSLPTWENPQVNADEPAGSSTIGIRNKAAGAGFTSALSWTGTHFSFNAAATFGGVTTFGTITVNVGVQGQTLGGSGPTLVYTPGSAAISLATPLNSGSNLQVEYKAANAGYVIVENTADVIARAFIEGGTGKYQQSSSDDTAVTLSEALQLAQQQLAAYGVIPSTLEFTTFQAGLYTGQVLDIVLSAPVAGVGFGDLVNTTLSPLTGQWFIQEINAESVPLFRIEDGEPVYLPGENGGHYRYTVRCIDVTQVGSWIDFWEGLSGGGGGSSAGSALFPGGGSLGPSGGSGTSYATAFTAVAGTPLTITHGLNTETIIAQAFDSSGNLMSFGNLTVVDANNISMTFGIGFTGKIVVLGA